jgi:hypothetical protein
MATGCSRSIKWLRCKSSKFSPNNSLRDATLTSAVVTKLCAVILAVRVCMMLLTMSFYFRVVYSCTLTKIGCLKLRITCCFPCQTTPPLHHDTLLLAIHTIA